MIELKNVASVYSGVNGRCCCGCAGKHTYASAHREASGKSRGYPVMDDEVSDRSVKIIVNKINALPVDMVGDNFVSAVKGERLYIAYFVRDL